MPAALLSGQIAINEADGVLFYRATGGTVTPLPTGGTEIHEYESALEFPATGVSPSVYVDRARGKIFRWETSVYVEVGPGAGGVYVNAAITSEAGDILTTESGDPLLF